MPRDEVRAPAGEPLPSDPNMSAGATSTRWDAPASGRSNGDASRFAPPRSARPATPVPVQPPAVEPAPSEPDIAGVGQPRQALADDPHMTAFPSGLGGAAPEADVSPNEYGAVPGYDDEGLLPPFESENLDGLIGPKRPRIGLIAIAAALVAVIVGGAAFYFSRSPQSGEPPIIAANS